MLTQQSLYQNRKEYPKHKWNQLYFSQTHSLVIGWHNRGQLSSIEELDLSELASKTGRSTKDTISTLKKLHNLLNRIKNHVENNSKMDSIEFNYEQNVLKIYECEPGTFEAIPEGLKKELF